MNAVTEVPSGSPPTMQYEDFIASIDNAIGKYATIAEMGAVDAARLSEGGLYYANGVPFTYMGAGYTSGPAAAPNFKPQGQTIYWEHFGAVGDADADNGTPTDDLAAMQAALDWAQLPANQDPAIRDDRGDPNGERGAPASISGMPGKTYGLSAGLTVGPAFKDGVVKDTAFKAIGTGWAATDFMFSRSNSEVGYVNLINCRFYLQWKCSGIETQSFWLLDRVTVRFMAFGGIGVRLRGVKTILRNCDIKEYTQNESAFFYDEANYGATGIEEVGLDARIEGGEIGWCAKLYATNTVAGGTTSPGQNTMFRGVHFFNGMEDFALYNKDGTTVAANPGGTPATGRDNPIGVEINHPMSTRFYECYMDNCRIDAYHDDGLSFVDCHWNSNSSHSNGNQTEWIRNYASVAGDVSSIVVSGALAGVDSLPKKIVVFLDNGANTWAPDFTAWEASDLNLLNNRKSPREIAGEFNLYGTNGGRMVKLFSQGTNGFIAIQDKDSTSFTDYGVDVDQAVIRTPNGTLRLSEWDGATEVTTMLRDNARLLLENPNASGTTGIDLKSKGANNSFVDFYNDDVLRADVFWDTANTRFTIGTPGAHDIYLRTNNTDAIVVSSAQDVTIPNGDLTISTGGAFPHLRVTNEDSTGDVGYRFGTETSGDFALQGTLAGAFSKNIIRYEDPINELRFFTSNVINATLDASGNFDVPNGYLQTSTADDAASGLKVLNTGGSLANMYFTSGTLGADFNISYNGSGASDIVITSSTATANTLNGLWNFAGGAIRVNGTKVVGTQVAALPADATDLASAITLVNAIKDAINENGHGLTAGT